MSPDGSGEFHLIHAATTRGESWIRVNIPRAALTPEGDVMVGPDYLPDLVAGMRADGLQLVFAE